MKIFVVSLFLVIVHTCGLAQNLGANTFLFDSGWPSLGYGFSIEYNHSLSDDFDLSTQSSILFNNKNSTMGELKYFHLPVLVGIKYFLLKSILTPYISVELMGSYFDYDNSVFDSEFGSRVINENGFYFGGSGSIGTLVKVAEQWNININVRLGINSNRYADFISYNIGFNHKL
jgi:hypothetical protein